MSYNNQPDWETYKLLDDYKESSFKSQYKKHTTDKDSWDNIAPMKDWTLEDYKELHLYISDGDLIPHEYYPNSWIAKEEEEEEEEAHKKKKFKIVIKNKPNFEEEFKKWNDFNTEWLKYYNFFRLRLRFNNKSVEEMKELCDTIGYEVLEKQKQSNILKTNTWCKTLLNMEAEEQNRTALKTYSILKKYDNQIKGIRKIIQKAVNTNMVN